MLLETGTIRILAFECVPQGSFSGREERRGTGESGWASGGVGSLEFYGDGAGTCKG